MSDKDVSTSSNSLSVLLSRLFSDKEEDIVAISCPFRWLSSNTNRIDTSLCDRNIQRRKEWQSFANSAFNNRTCHLGVKRQLIGVKTPSRTTWTCTVHANSHSGKTTRYVQMRRVKVLFARSLYGECGNDKRKFIQQGFVKKLEQPLEWGWEPRKPRQRKLSTGSYLWQSSDNRRGLRVWI